jgi:hypothetical protein
MSNRHSQLQHRLHEAVKRELGPEYIRLFAPHFLSHGMPAGIAGMMLSCAAILSLLMPLEGTMPLPLFFIIGVTVGVFAYAFPFQNMVMGKSCHLRYFKIFGMVCTTITAVAASIMAQKNAGQPFLHQYFVFIPVIIGIFFCLIVHSKKFAAMLAYQQKLWVIKQRLIKEEKALVAEFKRKTKNRPGV